MGKRVFIKEDVVLATTPTTPDAGFVKLYQKTDGLWYFLESDGIESPLSPAAQTGYTVFPIWAEENGNLTPNNRQYSFGNGSVGPVNIPMIDCEIFAIGIETELGTGTSVDIDIYRNDAINSSVNFTAIDQFITLPTTIPFSEGDNLGFGTGALTGIFTDVRVVVWCRIPLLGLQGGKGDPGTPTVQRDVYQLTGGYNINTNPATSILVGSLLNGNITGTSFTGGVISLPEGQYDVCYTISATSAIARSNQAFALDVTNGQSFTKFAPLYARISSNHNDVGVDLSFPVTIGVGGGSIELLSILESVTGNVIISASESVAGITAPASYLSISKIA